MVVVTCSKECSKVKRMPRNVFKKENSKYRIKYHVHLLSHGKISH